MTRLALVMIARDEAPRIGRALDSARSLVDRMIVLDTGSTDGTPQIAAAHGAEVHAFAWCDDFAAARNAALALSDADWNLVLDADEWIEAGDEALSPASLAEPFIGHVQVASSFGEGAAEALSRSWIARLLPRGTLYHGRIHEEPRGPFPGKRLRLVLGHDGYKPEGLARKEGRNEALLARELEAAPDDPYLWHQLGREHQARERWDEAARCFVQALNLDPARAAPFRHGLVVRAITALKNAGRMNEALGLADAELPHWSASPDFHFVVGDLYLEQASRDPERALKDHLPIVEWAWKRCLEIGERDDLDGSVRGRGGYIAAHNLAVMFETVGLADLAQEYRSLSERLRAA